MEMPRYGRSVEVRGRVYKCGGGLSEEHYQRNCGRGEADPHLSLMGNIGVPMYVSTIFVCRQAHGEGRQTICFFEAIIEIPFGQVYYCFRWKYSVDPYEINNTIKAVETMLHRQSF